MSNPCTEPTSALLYNLFKQKRQVALYNIPPIRLNLVSPYPTHTQAQLDMRRKVEILKYKNQNTQTNGLTKSQRWAQLVSGSASSSTISQAAASTSDLTCASDLLIPTLTSACDVPGPPIYLTYDPTVSLYNYISSNRTYAIVNNEDASIWKIYTVNELLIAETSAMEYSLDILDTYIMNLGVIIITDYIKTPQTTYSISTPIAIWCSGLLTGTNLNLTTLRFDNPKPVHVDPIVITITRIALNILYNDTIVYAITLPSTFANPYNLTPFVIDLNNTQDQTFYAIQYVGMLALPAFTLNTQSGNIYNLSLTFTYTFTDPLNNSTYDFTGNKINAFKAGVFCNLSSGNQNTYANPNQILDNGQVSAVTSLPNTTTPYTSGSFTNFISLVSPI